MSCWASLRVRWERSDGSSALVPRLTAWAPKRCSPSRHRYYRQQWRQHWWLSLCFQSVPLLFMHVRVYTFYYAEPSFISNSSYTWSVVRHWFANCPIDGDEVVRSAIPVYNRRHGGRCRCLWPKFARELHSLRLDSCYTSAPHLHRSNWIWRPTLSHSSWVRALQLSRH